MHCPSYKRKTDTTVAGLPEYNVNSSRGRVACLWLSGRSQIWSSLYSQTSVPLREMALQLTDILRQLRYLSSSNIIILLIWHLSESWQMWAIYSGANISRNVNLSNGIISLNCYFFHLSHMYGHYIVDNTPVTSGMATSRYGHFKYAM